MRNQQYPPDAIRWTQIQSDCVILLQDAETLKFMILQGGECMDFVMYEWMCDVGIFSNWVISCFYKVEEHPNVILQGGLSGV